MRKLVLLFFLISLFNTQAQNWCTPNSTWYYALPQPGDGYAKYTYLYDTLLGSQMCNKIKTEYNGHGMGGFVINYSSYIYTYYQNGVVFKNNGTINAPLYDTLYCFNGAIGTKWRCQLTGIGGGSSCANSYIEITDIGTTVIQGQTLNWRKIFYKNFYFYGQVQQWMESGTDTIFERIGTRHNMEFITGNYCADATDITPMSFRCFADNQINLNFSGVACDYVTGIKNNITESEQVTFNNPASDVVILKLASSKLVQQVELYDQFGKKVKDVLCTEKEIRIDVQDLASGIYILQVKYRTETVNRKLVIQRS